jgi:pyruvate ferredoxin oxidoreductase alpha subunit
MLVLGSAYGTLYQAREQDQGETPVRLIKLRAFRPFPAEALRQACQGLDRLIVLERALSPGAGGILGAEVRAALSEMPEPPRVHNYAIGLGGRDIPLDIYRRLLEGIQSETPSGFRIFDLEPERLEVSER